MGAEVLAARFDAVSAHRGESIRARRVRLGIGVKPLAMRAGVDRGTLAAIEAGDERARETTYAAVERALELLEQEMGIEPAGGNSADVVEFRVAGNFGVDVVVKGPIRDLPALEASVARLMERLAAERPDDATQGDGDSTPGE